MAGITAKEIAEKLGISASTVSLALNGKNGVSKTTRAEVIRLANQYGYMVPRAARNRHSGAKRMICFLIYVDKVNRIAENTPFSTFVLQGIETAASALGYKTMIRYYTAGSAASIAAVEMFNEVDALIVLGTDITENNQDEIRYLFSCAGTIPIAVIDNYLFADIVDCIGNDNMAGAAYAVRYLIERGCKTIGYIRSKQRISNFNDREAGVYQALAQAGFALHSVADAGICSEEAYLDIRSWLQQNPALPDGYFADNDILAMAAIRAMRSLNIQIPEDVSVIGFDDIPACDISDPPLTTMRSYKECLGATAVHLINERLCGAEQSFIAQSGPLKVQVAMRVHARMSVRQVP